MVKLPKFTIPIILMIIIIGGAYAISQMGVLGQVAIVDGESCVLKAAIPSYGQYSCEIDQAQPTTIFYKSFYDADDPSTGGHEWEADVYCPEGGLTNTCELFIKNDYTGWLSTPIVRYGICDIGVSPCPAVNSFRPTKGIKTILRDDMPSGSYAVFITYPSIGTPSESYLRPGESHFSYVLYQTERGAKQKVAGVTECNIPGFKDLCIDCILPTGETGTIFNNPIASLPPGGFSTYLKEWLVGIYETNFHQLPNGQWADCSHGKVYDLSTIRMESGCYAFPDRYLTSLPGSYQGMSLECCPGERFGTQFCGDNWKWESEDIGVCVRGGIASITYCDGQGGWVSIGNNQYRKATSCDSTTGQCSYQTVTPPCTSFSGCPPGSECVEDLNNPMNNYCRGGCTPGFDRNGDCIDDCTLLQIPGCVIQDCALEGQVPTLLKTCCSGLQETDGVCRIPGNGEVPWAFLIFTGLFSAIIGIYLYLTKKKEKLWAVLGVISVITVMSLIHFIIIPWFVKNALLLGLVGLAGGWAIYAIFGLGAFTTIAVIIKSMVGRK